VLTPELPPGDSYILSNLLTGSSRAIWHKTIRDQFGNETAWTSDGKKVAFVRTTLMDVSPTICYLYVCDLVSDSTKLVLEVKAPRDPGMLVGINSFCFSPDGTRIAYSVEGNIYCSDL
jgi:Tol biopolymer transport system component